MCKNERWCSQFTNEELKLQKKSCRRRNKNCSQFTNEELKLHPKKIKLWVLAYVRNLPMRSWNQILCSPNTPDWKKFAIYQWGVETAETHFLYKTEKTCSQFTNEELKHKVLKLSSSFSTRSQFTNEELKLMEI